jgi:hypothetical protein
MEAVNSVYWQFRPRGSIFLGKWLRAFAGNCKNKRKVQSPCALNTLYMHTLEPPNQLAQLPQKLGYRLCERAILV